MITKRWSDDAWFNNNLFCVRLELPTSQKITKMFLSSKLNNMRYFNICDEIPVMLVSIPWHSWYLHFEIICIITHVVRIVCWPASQTSPYISIPRILFLVESCFIRLVFFLWTDFVFSVLNPLSICHRLASWWSMTSVEYSNSATTEYLITMMYSMMKLWQPKTWNCSRTHTPN